MKKLCTLLVLLTMTVFSVTAKQVGVSTAKQAGQYFLSSRISDASSKRLASLTLAYTAASKLQNLQAAQNKAYFYIFNAPSGFVIVAGDDAIAPILGYSTEGSFNPDNIPENAAKWFEGYIQQIRQAINHTAQATPAVQSAWQKLLEGKQAARIAGASAVEPLLKTKWNQAPFYNDLCPYDPQYKERTVTGCAATAMAQIMKYWNHPAKGSGFHSYVHKKYGTLSANFGDATYDWAAMPDEVTAANNAVATLNYHVGVSIDMSYGVGKTGGSGAGPFKCIDALKKYFGYADGIEGLQRKDFTDDEWKVKLKAELDSKRPISYAGFGVKGGHAFVCDGYDNNGLFHFNWGWGGSSDGYFTLDALNPPSLGTGGGGGGFNSDQLAVIKIKPVEVPVLAMRLSEPLILSASTINFGAPFTATVNITNSGNTPFAGDIAAAVFEKTGKSVGFVEVKTGQSLAAGASFPSNLVFSTVGIAGMLPGDYYVRIYYRQAEGDWKKAEDYINFSNYAEIKVVLQNDLQLTSAMTPTPATFIKGESASVAMKIKNISAAEFSGGVGVGLFSLAGELVEVIEEKAGTLPAGGESDLAFTTDAIGAEPGTYYIACLYQKDGGEITITGSSTYPNPITVTVALPKLVADKFEPNNEPSQATVLTVVFSGNSGSTNTGASNCHEGEGTDYDFYKINLPAGDNYAIKPRLHDAANSGNGNTYSLDALFAYSTDGGNTWSDAYDDVMDTPVQMPGGTTILFGVSPYFAAESGTYLLEIGVEKSGSMSVNENDFAAAINLYPNPATGSVSIDTRNISGSVWRVELVSLQGLVLAATDVVNNGIVNLPLSGAVAGVYAVRVHGSDGVITKKIIVE
ncbi:MAG: thiol protease/hemagglutinin PrtT [Bacteroidetes bacterium]|nr:thiol protease/hemagglutinin PrtT [Bacteroidota bacterium]